MQSAVSQKNRRTCRMSCTRKPAQGKSAATRVYWLWRRWARQKQSGQHDFFFVEMTRTTNKSSRMVVVTLFNPLGRGRNGEENIRQLQTRDCSSLQSHPSFYHFLPSKRASSKARENHMGGYLPHSTGVSCTAPRVQYRTEVCGLAHASGGCGVPPYLDSRGRLRCAPGVPRGCRGFLWQPLLRSS